MNLSDATAARTARRLNPTTLIQCQDFWIPEILFFFTVKYMWLARTKVKGKVLSAPVRLMKSPRNGSSAATRVFTVRYPPLTITLKLRFSNENAFPFPFPYLVSKYSYIGLAKIWTKYIEGLIREERIVGEMESFKSHVEGDDRLKKRRDVCESEDPCWAIDAVEQIPGSRRPVGPITGESHSVERENSGRELQPQRLLHVLHHRRLNCCLFRAIKDNISWPKM